MSEDFLWAPWRMDYISNPDKEQNIFIKKAKSKNDRDNLVLYRAKKNFVIMNLYPYNNGHLMIVPYDKHDDMTNLDIETLHEIMKLAQESMRILKAKLKSEGFNFGLNMGKAAGAGIDNHLHLIIIIYKR